MNKTIVKTIIVLFLLSQALSAQPAALDVLVGQENADALRRGENVTRFQGKNVSASLLPSDEYLQNMTNKIIREVSPSFLVETLSVYRKPSAAAWNAAQRSAVFNQSLALSTLAGLQYYSIRRARMHTFYETSTVVSAADGKTPVPDPSYAFTPNELTIYARQKDSSFGDNIYSYNYYARPDSLVFVQENLTDMKYGIVTAMGKNKLRSVIAVYDAGEFLLIYMVSMAKASSIPGMNDRIGGSFSNRAEAILSWFSGRLAKVF